MKTKNYKFRKKPVVIEAFQMTKERREDNSEWPEWLNKAWQMSRHDVGAVFPTLSTDPEKAHKISINTLEGEMLVNWNDYIIQGIQEELYPCKPEIFEATYEKE